MNGANSLIAAAIAGGIDVCFTNFGTTEIPLVLALDTTPGMRAYPGLFEGVCTGAADGYGRMLDKPAMTLLHLGPGFANGIANLHNARRAHSPVVNVVGEHATWHLSADPPLAMDIEGLARTVSGWWRTSRSAGEIAGDVREAITAARLGQVATLAVPHDFQVAECDNQGITALGTPFERLDPEHIESLAARLRSYRNVAVILGRRGLRTSGLAVAHRLRNVLGCDLFAPTLPGYIERGAGLPVVQRVPYFPEQATAAFAPYDAILLAGATEPVTFFGYPGVPGLILRDDQEKIRLCTDRQDEVQALGYLADALGTRHTPAVEVAPLPAAERAGLPTSELTPEKACAVLAAMQPENAIIIDEGVMTGYSYYALTAGLPPHSILMVSGGSIGQGIPCAAGAAIACPDRPVIGLQADGSALFTVQGLWTQAREGLNVTTLICANRSYRILQTELGRMGITPGPNARALTNLTQPAIDWVQIARGFGVPGVSVTTAEQLAREIGKALAEPGPHLIEMCLP